LVKLIDKTDGDLRPILWFRSAYRVYCRARSWEVKNWKQRRLKGTLFNNLNGQNIGDEIWRDAVQKHLGWGTEAIRARIFVGRVEGFRQCRP
jgi:hypothetical protein